MSTEQQTEKLDAGTGGSIEALLQKLRDALTCNRFGGGHYCPNCDNGFGPQLVDELAAALLTRRDQPEPKDYGVYSQEVERELSENYTAATRRDAPQEPHKGKDV